MSSLLSDDKDTDFMPHQNVDPTKTFSKRPSAQPNIVKPPGGNVASPALPPQNVIGNEGLTIPAIAPPQSETPVGGLSPMKASGVKRFDRGGRGGGMSSDVMTRGGK